MRGRLLRGGVLRGRVLRGGVMRAPFPRERVRWDADRLQAALNVLGGVAFLAGSLLFLDPSLMRLGIGLFVLGSFSMAVGAVAVWRQRYAVGRADRDPEGESR